MKTTSFSSLKVVYQGDVPDVTLVMKVPGREPMEMDMSPDELYLFLVEVGNGLSESRARALEVSKLLELHKEKMRGN